MLIYKHMDRRKKTWYIDFVSFYNVYQTEDWLWPKLPALFGFWIGLAR